MSRRAPHALHTLAASRVAYQGGRFLAEACERLPRADMESIVAWAIETNQPGIMEPQTTSALLARLARDYYARHLK